MPASLGVGQRAPALPHTQCKTHCVLAGFLLLAMPPSLPLTASPCLPPFFSDMLERTLAARGVLAGAAGAAGTPQQNDGALSGSGSGAGGAARAGSDSTASDGVVRVSGASASAAATTPGAAGQLHKQQSGSGGPPVASRGSGYSSMAAEVGSMAEGAPRSALDSQLGGSSKSRR